MAKEKDNSTEAGKKEAETKAAEEKIADTKADEAAEKLGADFDKKADEEFQTAYTETEEEKEAKAKAAEEKTSAEEKTGEKDPDEVDESLLERAEKAGISREDAEHFGSKEALERTVKLLEDSQSKKEKSTEETEAEKKAKEEAEAKAKEDEAPYDCGLDSEEYDEGLIKSLNDLGTKLKKRVVALEAELTKNREALVSNSVTRYTNWLDSKINRLPDDLKEIYGDEEFEDLDEGSDKFKARATLDTKIRKLVTDYRNSNKKVPSRNKLFDEAIKALHKSKSKKADAKTKAKLEERAKETLGKGSGKVSVETAEERALQANKEFDKKIDEE